MRPHYALELLSFSCLRIARATPSDTIGTHMSWRMKTQSAFLSRFDESLGASSVVLLVLGALGGGFSNRPTSAHSRSKVSLKSHVLKTKALP